MELRNMQPNLAAENRALRALIAWRRGNDVVEFVKPAKTIDAVRQSMNGHPMHISEIISKVREFIPGTKPHAVRSSVNFLKVRGELSCPQPNRYIKACQV